MMTTGLIAALLLSGIGFIGVLFRTSSFAKVMSILFMFQGIILMFACKSAPGDTTGIVMIVLGTAIMMVWIALIYIYSKNHPTKHQNNEDS